MEATVVTADRHSSMVEKRVSEKEQVDDAKFRDPRKNRPAKVPVRRRSVDGAEEFKRKRIVGTMPRMTALEKLKINDGEHFRNTEGQQHEELLKKPLSFFDDNFREQEINFHGQVNEVEARAKKIKIERVLVDLLKNDIDTAQERFDKEEIGGLQEMQGFFEGETFVKTFDEKLQGNGINVNDANLQDFINEQREKYKKEILELIKKLIRKLDENEEEKEQIKNEVIWYEKERVKRLAAEEAESKKRSDEDFEFASKRKGWWNREVQRKFKLKEGVKRARNLKELLSVIYEIKGVEKTGPDMWRKTIIIQQEITSEIRRCKKLIDEGKDFEFNLSWDEYGIGEKIGAWLKSGLPDEEKVA